MNRKLITFLTQISLLFLCGASHAQQPQSASTTLVLENITYEEALKAYRSANRDENYRCTHKIADDQYNAKANAQVIAIAIDDVLYLKLNGRLLELTQTDINEKSAVYKNSDIRIEAGYTIIKQFNYSEYNESDDRNVDLWIKSPRGTQIVKTFGDRCGI